MRAVHPVRKTGTQAVQICSRMLITVVCMRKAVVRRPRQGMQTVIAIAADRMEKMTGGGSMITGPKEKSISINGIWI